MSGRGTLAEQIARHVIESPERHVPPTPHCDYCWESWPCTVELMRRRWNVPPQPETESSVVDAGARLDYLLSTVGE